MIDKCEKCLVRGHMKECLIIPCYNRESWYVIEQNKTIDELKAQVNLLRGNILTIDEMVRNFAFVGDSPNEIQEAVTCVTAHMLNETPGQSVAQAIEDVPDDGFQR